MPKICEQDRDDIIVLLVSSVVLVHFDSILEVVLVQYFHTTCLMGQKSQSHLLIIHIWTLKGVIPKLRKRPLLLYSEWNISIRISMVDISICRQTTNFWLHCWVRVGQFHKWLLGGLWDGPWLTLSSYEYTLVFRSTTQHGNADAMSRLPLPESPREIPDPTEWVLLIEGLKDSPISSAQIRTWTRRDSLLSQVLRCVQQGWLTVVTEELKPYWNRRLELSVYDGCLLWGSRVVVPPPGRNQALRELHGGHPGCSRMKSLARMFCWWPGMDAEIETLVWQCPEC